MIMKLRKPVDKCRTSVRRYVQTKHRNVDERYGTVKVSSFSKSCFFIGSGLGLFLTIINLQTKKTSMQYKQ